MANVGEQVKGSAGRIGAWIKKHPAIAALIAAGVVVLAYIAYRNNQSGSSPTGTQQTGQDPNAAAGGGLGDLGAAAPPTVFPPTQTIGGGGGQIISGGGGGGSRPKASKTTTSSGGGSLLTSPTAFTSTAVGAPDPFTQLLQSAYTNPVTGQTNLFETQAAGDLINNYNPPTHTPISGVSQNLQAAAGIVPTPPPTMNQPVNQLAGGKTGGPVTSTIAENIQQNTAAAAIYNFFNNVGNAISSIFGGSAAPSPTNTAGVSGKASFSPPVFSEGGLAYSTPALSPAQMSFTPSTVTPSATLPASPASAAYLPKPNPVAPQKTTVGVGKRKVVGQVVTNSLTGTKNVRY